MLKQYQQQFVDNLQASTPEPIFLHQFGQVSQTAEKFSIYRNNHQTSLIKSLALIYPVCQRLVGIPFFQALARRYIAEYPSRYTNLNDYGAEFADYIRDFPKTAHLPYLTEVATLEWHIHRITIGPLDKTFDWSALTHISLEQQTDLILHRVQNSALLPFEFPVDRIWETNQPDFLGDDTVNLAQGGCYLFIRRISFDIRIVRLTKTEWYLLTLIDGQLSLGMLLADPIIKAQNIDVLEKMPRLIKDGYVANFSLLD